MKTNRMLRIAFIIACGVLFSTAGFAQATKKPAAEDDHIEGGGCHRADRSQYGIEG